MKVAFHDADAVRPLATNLDEVLADAEELRVAVAYCTPRGVAELRRFCTKLAPSPKHPAVRAVVSVRSPTDLEALAGFAKDWPGVLWIHLGRELPQERSDRGHFHSKVVAVRRAGGQSTILVGSHNWTCLALDGWNREASVRVDCASDDPFAKQARAHIRACRGDRGCVPYDPANLAFYQQLQKHYTWTVAGGEQGIDVYRPLSTLVLHAEADTPDLLDLQEVRLYLDVDLEKLQRELVLGRPFRLHLYGPGELFDAGRRQRARPVLFEGTVTMVNQGADGKVGSRPITARVDSRDLQKPVMVAAQAIPLVRDEGLQFVASLARRGPGEGSIYHWGPGGPRLRVKPEFETFERLPRASRSGTWLSKASRRGDKVVEKVPTGFQTRAVVVVPDLDAPGRAPMLEDVHHRRRDGESVEFRAPEKPPRWFTPYFYASTHVLDADT